MFWLDEDIRQVPIELNALINMLAGSHLLHHLLNRLYIIDFERKMEWRWFSSFRERK